MKIIRHSISLSTSTALLPKPSQPSPFSSPPLPRPLGNKTQRPEVEGATSWSGLRFLKPIGARNPPGPACLFCWPGRRGESAVRGQDQGGDVKRAGVREGPQQSDEGLGKGSREPFSRLRRRAEGEKKRLARKLVRLRLGTAKPHRQPAA